jgi:hypothetical protein
LCLRTAVCAGGLPVHPTTRDSESVSPSRAEIDTAWKASNLAVVHRDGEAAVPAAGAAAAVGLLQGAGSALLVALDRGNSGADPAVATLAQALTDRDWEGDVLLADLLTTTAARASTGRSRLGVELDDLADVLEAGVGGMLDLRNGQAWSQEIIDAVGLDQIGRPDEAPECWLEIGWGSTRDAWHDMSDFTDSMAGDPAFDTLAAAIDGRGAFKRFQAALDRHPRLRARWRVDSSERRTGRARAWLAQEGYDATP